MNVLSASLLLCFFDWNLGGAAGFASQTSYVQTFQYRNPNQSIICHCDHPFIRDRTSSSSTTTLRAMDDSTDAAAVSSQSEESRLLSLLQFIQNRDPSVFRSPCALDATEPEQNLVRQVVDTLLADPVAARENNLLYNREAELSSKGIGSVSFEQLKGHWELVYTNSRTMIINKSLSGLGRSESEMAKLLRLRLRLGGTKFLGQSEFTEDFGSNSSDDDIDDNDDDGSDGNGLSVSIPGEWFTKSTISAITGQPTTSIEIIPERVIYGPSNNNAKDWSSLGPIKLLDLLYLSQNIMISYVQVNPEYIFIWKKIEDVNNST